MIASSGEWSGLGVVDPEQRFLVLPLAFMDEMFSTGGESDFSPKLIYNCIKEENLPSASPNEFVLLT